MAKWIIILGLIESCTTSKVSEKLGPDGLTKQEVLGGITPSMHQIRKCYEGVLEPEPSPQGLIQTKFVIDLQGAVESAEALPKVQYPEGQVEKHKIIHHPKLEACVLETVKKLKFTKPLGKEKVTVYYPFIFRRTGDEPDPPKKSKK